MGGLTFILSTCLTLAAVGLFSLGKGVNLSAIAVLVTGTLCGIVGLLDDSAKVRNKANKGISGQVRLAIETLLGLALGVLLLSLGKNILLLPVCLSSLCTGAVAAAGQPYLFLALPAVVYLLLAAFLAAATTNAVNLHDGMDGLAAGTACQVFATLSVMFFETNQIAYATISATAAGALLGFLIYNRNPAQIFMGDTGSLFIGGLLACLVIAGGMTLWFVPLSLIYIIEALSVIAQVVYFKLTKPYTGQKALSGPALAWFKLTKKLPGEGKRLFRMAPLHHHYEAVFSEKGVSEWQVVAWFWLVQFGLCLSVLLAFHYLRG